MNVANPFPGPTALGENEPVFGRDEEIATVRGLLLAERLVVLHGVSGAGKSSLLRGRGGIRHSFQQEKGFLVLGPLDMRLPSVEGPPAGLYEQVLVESLAQAATQAAAAAEPPVQSALDLELLLMRLARDSGQRYQLLIIDQFEEIFTRYPQDETGREAFFGMLGGLMQRHEGLRVLLAMRDEFIGELDRFRRCVPGRLKTSFRLELMRASQAAEAIQRTALGSQPPIRLCEGDVTRLVENLSQLDRTAMPSAAHERHCLVEPLLLQLACRDAWPRVVERWQALQGGAAAADCVPLPESESRSDLDKVLGEFYASVVHDAERAHRGSEFRLRVFVQDALMTPGGLRALASGADAERHYGLTAAELGVLVDAHIVRTQQRHDSLYYELPHDRLIEPIRNNNRDWLDGQPGWRRRARSTNLEGSYRAPPVADVLAAWRARHAAPDRLLPYELAYVNHVDRSARSVVLLLSGWVLGIVLVSWGVTEWATRATRLAKNQAQSLRADVQQTQKRLDLEKALRAYTTAKYIERRDDKAVLQVRQAYEELKRRYPNAEDQRPFEGQFVQAFSIALATSRDSPGFSRTFDLLPEPGLPVAFAADAATPWMAYAEANCLRAFALYSGQTGAACVAALAADEHPLDSLRWSPRAGLLGGLNRRRQLVLLTQDPTQSRGSPLPEYRSTGDAVTAFTFSDDEQLVAYHQGAAVRLLCRGNAGTAWVGCGEMPLGWAAGAEVTALDIGAIQAGRRRLAVGSAAGHVLVADLLQVSGGWSVSARQDIDPPRPMDGQSKLAPQFAVVMLDHLHGTTPGLVVAHADKRLRLVAPEGSSWKSFMVEPTKGLERVGPDVVNDGVTLQSAALTEQNELFVVVKDQLTRWRLAEASPPDDRLVVTVPVERLEIGTRRTRQLAAGSTWLLAQDHFHTWLWERSDIPASKLMRARLPGDDNGAFGDKIFHPQALAFRSDDTLYSGTSQHGLHGWQLGDGTTASWRSQAVDLACGPGASRSVRALATSPDGTLLAVAMGPGQTGKGAIAVLSTENPAVGAFCDAALHDDGLWSVAFSSDGRWLVSGDYRGRVALWSVARTATAPPRVELRARIDLSGQTDAAGDPVYGLTFHPTDAALLAVGQGSGRVQLLTIGDGAAGPRLNSHADLKGQVGASRRLAFSADGNWLASAGEFGPIQLWRAKPASTAQASSHPEFDAMPPLVGHAGGTVSLAFRPSDGKNILASGGADGALSIWTLGDRLGAVRPVTLSGNGGDLLSLAWNRDGKRLAAGFRSARGRLDPVPHGEVMLWDWDLEGSAAIACSTVWRGLDKLEWQEWQAAVRAGDAAGAAAHQDACAATAAAALTAAADSKAQPRR